MSKEELYNIVFDTPELKEYVENKDKEIERLKYYESMWEILKQK